MKQLIIGIDIDGVIVDLGTAILPILSEVCDRPVSYQDLCQWDLGEALNIDKKTMANTWKQIRDLPPEKETVYNDRKICERGERCPGSPLVQRESSTYSERPRFMLIKGSL